MDGLTISNASRFIENAGTSATSTNKLTDGNPQISKSGEGQKSFADTLKEAIGNVNELQKESDAKVEALATGKTDDIAGVMITAEKAEIALRAMVQVRNKIIDAYQDIMKMQV
jgi:flagellar hook-basal body complex protein FliE